MPQPKQGEVWSTDTELSRAELKNISVVVVSADSFNMTQAETVLVVPIYTQKRGLPSRVSLDGAGCNLDGPAFAACEQVRSIHRSRLKEPAVGMIAHDTLETIKEVLARLIGFRPSPRIKGWGG